MRCRFCASLISLAFTDFWTNKLQKHICDIVAVTTFSSNMFPSPMLLRYRVARREELKRRDEKFAALRTQGCLLRRSEMSFETSLSHLVPQRNIHIQSHASRIARSSMLSPSTSHLQALTRQRH